MRIVILGAGGMGCRFALSFKASGADVVLCDTWKEHIDNINANGLKVIEGEKTEFVKFEATTDISTVKNIDALVVFTKSNHTEAAVKSAMGTLGSDVPVITFQNGLGNINILEKYVGKERIIAGVTNLATSLLAPGVVDVEGTGFTKLMALAEKQKDLSIEICRLLKDSGMNCSMSADIMKEIWEKVGFNCSMNTITSLTRQRVMYMGGSPYGFELCSLIAAEVAAVALSEGVNYDYSAVIATYRKVLDPRESGEHITSMLQDVIRCKATEIDSICGAVLQIAEKKGIATPHLKTVYNLIKIIEENYEVQVKV